MKAFIEEMIAEEPGKLPEDSVAGAEAKETGPVKSEKALTPNDHSYGDNRFWTAPEQHADDLAELMAEVEEGEVVCELVRGRTSQMSDELTGTSRMFDVQLPLKAWLRGRQPFDNVLPSTIITAIIFSFFGRKADVC